MDAMLRGDLLDTLGSSGPRHRAHRIRDMGTQAHERHVGKRATVPAFVVAVLCVACGGSPSTPTVGKPAPAVQLTVEEGLAAIGGIDNLPAVSYSACGSFVVADRELVVASFEIDPIGPDGSTYAARRIPSTQGENGIPGLVGCGLAISYDQTLTHVPATSYRLRVRYHAVSGSAEGVVEGMAAVRSSLKLPPKLMISEFRTRGPHGESDQFIELVNESLTPKNLVGVNVFGAGNGTSDTGSITLTSGTVGPGCHYLLTAPGYSGAVRGDATMAAFLRDDGHIREGPGAGGPVNEIFRYIGLNPITQYREGTALSAFGEANTDRSYVRVGDTYDNSRDFRMISPSQPQNSSSCGP